MSRETENALLLLLGIVTSILVVTGVYTRYVKPSLLPWLAAVAVFSIALALSGIIRNLRQAGDHDAQHIEHSGHVHRGGIAWLILIPVVILAFVVPPALGAQGASQVAITLSPNELRKPFPPLPPGRAPEVSIKEVMKRAALDSADTLYGRTITLVGFTLKADNRVDLARVSIFCCAADAQLGRVHLAGQNAAATAQLPDNTWLRVEGTLTKPAESSGPPTTLIPTMTVSTTMPVDPPANTYAY